MGPRPNRVAGRAALLLPILTLCALLAPATGQAAGPRAPARAEGIRVLNNSVRSGFPESLTFELEVDGPRPIAEVTLQYRLAQQRCAPTTSSARAELIPGPNSTLARWTWSLRRSGSVPPDVLLEYAWAVEDSEGGRLEVPSAQTRLSDSRYSWQRREGENFTVSWYRGGEEFGQALTTAASEALARQEREAGIRLTQPVQLYVYGDSQDLQRALVDAPTWVGGRAFPEYQTILLGIAPDQLTWGRRAIAHELSHQLTHQITFNCFTDLPRWLDEGLATYAEGAPDERAQALLARAIQDDSLASLRSLSSNFPAHSTEASLAYVQSASVVRYLLDTGGPEHLAALLGGLHDGQTVDEALLMAYQLNQAELERQWRQKIGAKPPVETPAPAVTTAQPESDPLRGLIRDLGLGGILMLTLGALGLVWLLRSRRTP